MGLPDVNRMVEASCKIVENIQAPVVVLHYPSERSLIREILTRELELNIAFYLIV